MGIGPLFVTPEQEAGGTLTGWFVPGTGWLVDATEEKLRVWDLRGLRLAQSLVTSARGLGKPHGGIVVHPKSGRLISVHENAAPPFEGKSVVAWELPDLVPKLERMGHAAVDPAISMGAFRRMFLTFSHHESRPDTPGLIVWDLEFRELARWKECPLGEPLPVEELGWIAVSRCRSGEPGVEIRSLDGAKYHLLAEDAPVTHLVRHHADRLWFFQEGGEVDVWDARRLLRLGRGDLGHGESMREDFPVGCVVCMDELNEQTIATLGSDGAVKFWKVPEWGLVYERAFEFTPSWIDVLQRPRMLAVGYFNDWIELYRIV
jgi:hypothetical protein